MQRILDPSAIEAFSEQSIPRIRLPHRATLFQKRAERLRQLGGSNAVGRSIADYLRLMASVADAQAAALPDAGTSVHGGFHIGVLERLYQPLLSSPSTPVKVREACAALLQETPGQIDAQAGALLARRAAEVEPGTAPFLMAALQVHWVDIASRLAPGDVPSSGAAVVCPVCSSLPVASIVTANQGYRYLTCALCATEWHMVRVKCSHCQSTEGIAYHSIEGGPESIRAESCDVCHGYLKILYQEKDVGVEAVADDLASLTLDLLMSEAGYHRGVSNPLLWQHS